MRERLDAILRGESSPTDAERTLLAIVRALRLGRRIFPDEEIDLGRAELKRRFRKVTDVDPIGRAVARAVQDLEASADFVGF